MKKLIKIVTVALIVLITLNCFNLTVFATEKTQDGLSATIISDKKSYNSDEDIKLSLKVTNTNDYEVDNVSLSAILPDGLKLKNEQNIENAVDKLGSGESLSLDLVLIQKESPTGVTEMTDPANKISNDKSVVNTGSVICCLGAVALVSGLSLAVVFIFRKKKKTSSIISLVLCSCLAIQIASATTLSVKSVELGKKTLTVIEKISVNNTEYEISGVISYGIATDNNTQSENTEASKNNGNSSANIQNGGVLAGKDSLIYYAHGGTIYQQDLKTDINTAIISLSDESGIRDINVFGDYLCYLVRPAGKSVHCMGSYAGILEIYNLSTKTYEFVAPEPSQNFPVIYNGDLYYLQGNGKYATEYISEQYALYNLCKYDFASKSTTVIKEDVYTLTLNDEKLIYGKIDKLIPAASDMIDISYYDIDDNPVNASGRMAWFAESNSKMGYLSSNYTLTDYKNFTYEAKNGAYVRTDEDGNESKLSSLGSLAFSNGRSPFGNLNYVYLNADIAFYVNDNGDVCKGDYNTGEETVLLSKSEYSYIGRLQIYNSKLYAVVDGRFKNIAYTGNGTDDIVPDTETVIPEVDIDTPNPEEVTPDVETVVPSADIEFKTMKKTGVYDNKLTYSQPRPGEYIQNSTVSFLPTSIRDKVGYYMMVDDYIYYIPPFSRSGGTLKLELRRMKLDGSGDELLANDVSLPVDCKYYNGKLYYVSSNDYNKKRATINTETLEKKSEELICSMNYYYNGLFYAINDNKICAYNFETGSVKDICQLSGNNEFLVCIDNNYLYYSVDDIYSGVTLYRVNLDTNETEKLKSQFSEDYIVNNGIVYYMPAPKAQMTGIIAYNIAEDSASVLGDLYVAEGIYDLWFEEGTLFYTVSNGNNGAGSNPSYFASDYIYDFNTNQYCVISNYYLPSF